MRKLSASEKKLVVMAGLALGILCYWIILLNPLLNKIGQTNAAVRDTGSQLQKVTAGLKVPRFDLDVRAQEAQSNAIIIFIDQRFKWHGIKLVGIKQTFGDNVLTIDLKCVSTFEQLLGFLNSLEKVETLLVVDKVEINQTGSRVTADFRLLSGYL